MTQPQKKREGKLLLRDHFLRYQNNLQQAFKEKITTKHPKKPQKIRQKKHKHSFNKIKIEEPLSSS